MTRKPRVNRSHRIGDGKISFIPNDGDHNGWLLLSSEQNRMVGKVQHAQLFKVFGTKYGGTEQSTTFGLPSARDCFLLMSGGKFKLGDKGGVETVTTAPTQRVTTTPTPPTRALLTSVLGIGLQDITHPPTVKVETIGDGSQTNMPPYLVVNVFVFSGVLPQ